MEAVRELARRDDDVSGAAAARRFLLEPWSLGSVYCFLEGVKDVETIDRTVEFRKVRHARSRSRGQIVEWGCHWRKSALAPPALKLHTTPALTPRIEENKEALARICFAGQQCTFFSPRIM